jgi:hypothetical protein
MSVAVNVLIILWDRLSPTSATLKLLMVDINTSVNYVHVDTFAAIVSIFVSLEGGERELLAVADARKTLIYAAEFTHVSNYDS